MRGAVNRMTLRFAGHAAFADLEHVGRKSGILRHTPVRAFRTGDTVIIGLNFGYCWPTTKPARFSRDHEPTGVIDSVSAGDSTTTRVIVSRPG